MRTAHCRPVRKAGKLPDSQGTMWMALGSASSSRARRVDLLLALVLGFLQAAMLTGQYHRGGSRDADLVLDDPQVGEATNILSPKRLKLLCTYLQITHPPTPPLFPFLPLLTPAWDDLYHP